MSNIMKSFGKSVSILIVVVIAITALTKEPLRLILLACAMGVWLIIVCIAFFHSLYRDNENATKSKAKKRRSITKSTHSGFDEMRQTNELQVTDAIRHLLMCHVNYRVSTYLKQNFPDVTWYWTCKDPEELAVRGGTGRIRLHGADKYTHCEITIDGNARIKCDLLCIEHMETTPKSLSEADSWFGMYGSVLDQICGDLESRGINDAKIRESGAVIIQTPGGEMKTEVLASFPKKDQWVRLAELLAGKGYDVSDASDGLYVSWVPAEVGA